MEILDAHDHLRSPACHQFARFSCLIPLVGGISVEWISRNRMRKTTPPIQFNEIPTMFFAVVMVSR